MEVVKEEKTEAQRLLDKKRRGEKLNKKESTIVAGYETQLQRQAQIEEMRKQQEAQQLAAERSAAQRERELARGTRRQFISDIRSAKPELSPSEVIAEMEIYMDHIWSMDEKARTEDAKENDK